MLEGENFYLLDASEKTPKLLTGPKGYAKKWLETIQYIAVYEMLPATFRKSVINPLADVFERIYRGESA